MAKIAYNACFGGFSISDAAIRRYAELKGIALYPENDGLFTTYWTVPANQRPASLEGAAWDHATQEERIANNEFYSANTISTREIARNDSILIQVIEELGAAANGQCADLRIADIPDGSKYRIDEYDGSESVETPDSYEWQTG